MSITAPVMVRYATSRKNLPSRIESGQPDLYTKLRRDTANAVALHRQLAGPDGVGLPWIPLKGYRDLIGNFLCEGLITESEAKSLASGFGKLCERLFHSEEETRNWYSAAVDYQSLSAAVIDMIHSERRQGTFYASNKKAQSEINRILDRSEKKIETKFEMMSRAAGFLRELKNDARSKGAQAGDRPTADEIRKALEVFCRLAQGELLKSIAHVEVGSVIDEAASKKNYNSLHKLKERFAGRLADAIHTRFGLKIDAISYKHIAEVTRDWPGVDLSRDLPALKEAARLGLPGTKIS